MSDINSVKAQIQSLIDLANTTTGNQDTNLTDGVNSLVGGYGQGGSGGGSASLNIHYGDTEPSDTSMLWCKCDEPTSVLVSPTTIIGGYNSVINSIGTMIYKYIYSAIGVVGDTVYILAGYNYPNAYDQIQTFNPTTNTDSTTDYGDHKYKTFGQKAGVVGSKIYLFGGKSYVSKSWTMQSNVMVYDTATRVITETSANLSIARQYMGVGVVGTKIYLFGGVSDSGLTNIIECFDTETETVSTLNVSLPNGLSHMGVGVVGTKIYLFGGRISSGCSNTIIKFDTETLEVTTLTLTLPNTLARMGACAKGKEIYLFGGENATDTFTDTIYVFNTETETVSSLSTVLPQPISALESVLIGDTIYSFGGQYNKENATDTNLGEILEFTIEAETVLENGKLQIHTNSSENLFDILSGDVEIQTGVSNVYLGNSDGQGEKVEAYLYQNDTWTQI